MPTIYTYAAYVLEPENDTIIVAPCINIVIKHTTDTHVCSLDRLICIRMWSPMSMHNLGSRRVEITVPQGFGEPH